jgi:Response regulator containing CheY-like receiver, AAA-type ATPase, and DNA-binding domains
MKVSSRKPVEPGRVPRTLSELMAAYERTIVIQALSLNGFSRKKAAASLGVSEVHLWRRMRLLKIDFSAIPKGAKGRPKKVLLAQERA